MTSRNTISLFMGRFTDQMLIFVINVDNSTPKWLVLFYTDSNVILSRYKSDISI